MMQAKDHLAHSTSQDVQDPVRWIARLGKQMFSQETTRKLPRWMEALRAPQKAAPAQFATPRTCFQAWHHVTQVFRLHKQLKTHGAQLKKDRTRAIMDEAARAAAAHDTRALYHAVRSLTPKQVRRTVVLWQAILATWPR